MRLAQLTQVARGLIALILLTAFLWQHQIIRQVEQGGSISSEDADRFDSYIRTLSWVQLATYVLAFIAFILWFYRAYQNVHRLPMAQPERQVEAAGWSWFVPIINLWYPYKIMQEIGHYIGRYSHPRETAISSRWDFVLVGWWVLYLGGIILSRFNLSGASDQGETFAELLRACRYQMLIQTVILLSSAVTLILLRMIAPHEQTLKVRHELVTDAAESPDAGVAGGGYTQLY